MYSWQLLIEYPASGASWLALTSTQIQVNLLLSLRMRYVNPSLIYRQAVTPLFFGNHRVELCARCFVRKTCSSKRACAVTFFLILSWKSKWIQRFMVKCNIQFSCELRTDDAFLFETFISTWHTRSLIRRWPRIGSSAVFSARVSLRPLCCF